MSRVTPLDPAAAQGAPKKLLDAVKSSLGATPNMTTTMAHSSVLEGWLALSGALRKGSISAADGERIALGVAEANRCSYCLSAHTYIASNVAKLAASEIESARHFESSDPTSAAILAFAEAALLTRGGISDADVDAARRAGLSDAQLGDIVGHVALNVLTNYFNRAFAVEIDFPVIEPHLHTPAA